MTPNEQKTALITGASGGIGEAFTDVLAADGYRTVLVARRGAELDRVRDRLTGRYGHAVTTIPLDLTRPDATHRLADELAALGLGPDVVVNNAGFGLAGAAASLPVEDQLAMIDLNVRCLSDLTLRFLPEMLRRRAGGIINVASVAAFLPGPNMAVYFATKSYVVSFSDAVHEEVRGSGVNVMSLCPGPVDTAFQARAGLKGARQLSSIRLPSAAAVAAEGYAGFKAGARQVIPGIANKLVAYASRGAPRRVVLPIALRAMSRAKA